MVKSKWILLSVLIQLTLLMACGPDTIWVRPGLDTPSQHVYNGHQLLERGKLDDACREFMRAKELDSQYTQAYVGLGLALAHKGDFQAAMETMDQARSLADTPDEQASVQDGYDQLKKLRQNQP
jgi:tetratricopeptide (TPR) repeat protein